MRQYFEKVVADRFQLRYLFETEQRKFYFQVRCLKSIQSMYNVPNLIFNAFFTI